MTPSSSAAAITAWSARRCSARAAARCWCWKQRPSSAARRAAEEFAPGFKVSLAHVLNRLHPEVISALDLASHGLRLRRQPCRASRCRRAASRWCCMAPMAKGWKARRPARRRPGSELRAQLIRYAGIMKPLLARRPPDLDGMPFSESRRLRHGRTGATPARQGGHARLPAHAADERRRRARRASGGRTAARAAGLRRDARQPSRPALADLAARPLLPPDRRDRGRGRRAGHPDGRHGRGRRSNRAGGRKGRRRRSAPARRSAGSSSRKAAPLASCSHPARKSGRAPIVSAANPRDDASSISSARASSTPALSARSATSA